MKNLLFCILISLSVMSCEVYEEPTYPTLSGEYVFDYITIDNESLVPSDTLVSGDSVFPIDTIFVGITKMKFSNDRIFFNPVLNQYSETEWSDEFFYVTRNYEYHGSGHIVSEINGRTFIFDIVEDNLERLVLRSNNNCFQGKNVPFTLTMVGP